MSELVGVAIRGISTAVPTRISRVADYPHMGAEEAERFSKSTGIRERRIIKGDQCASDLCAHAADDLLAKLGWERADNLTEAIAMARSYMGNSAEITMLHQPMIGIADME